MFKAASGKRIKPNICDAVRNHDTGQAVAELKREFSDARHSLADRHNCRGGAQLEREIPNGDHAVRNVDARQRSARVERAGADIHHTVWNHESRQIRARLERGASNICHMAAHGDVRQPGTLQKHVVGNARHAIRYYDARQAGAALKGGIRDTRDAAWDDISACLGDGILDKRRLRFVEQHAVRARVTGTCRVHRNSGEARAQIEGVGANVRH